jgi:hypothetical protein
MRKVVSIVVLAAFALTSEFAFGQVETFIYPAKEQDQKQIEKENSNSTIGRNSRLA